MIFNLNKYFADRAIRDNMYKQSLLKSNILSRIFIAFVLLLVVMLSLSLYNYYQAWLQSRQTALNSMATRLAYQIEDYRYQASHLYKLANDKSSATTGNDLSITEVRHDVFWLSSVNQTIDSIVFGSNKKSSNILATKLANYMEIVWGARNEFNSMYYLNGQDNTLVLVTTHSILKPELRYKESYLTLTAEDKRTDMLTQSTLLDRREIISNIQKYSPDDVFYYTYRLMFNSPGQLTSVISFDISINSLIPFSLQGDDLSINPRPNNLSNNKSSTSIIGTNLVFFQPIEGTNYQIHYRVSIKNLLLSILSYNFWLIACMLAVSVLALIATVFIRKRIISPNATILRELQFKEGLNHDIINNISYGILVYDFSTNKKILSNGIANQLLPSMDLTHIKEMATDNNDVIQVSIENNVYEIILVNSLAIENAILFIIIDKDKEVLTQKRQELAMREYQKNIQLRNIIFENMSSEILPSLNQIDALVSQLRHSTDLECNLSDINLSTIQIENQLLHIIHWFKNIDLLNQLEAQTKTLKIEKVSVEQLVSNFLKQSRSRLNDKGLSLYFESNINPESSIEINPTYLQHLLQLVWEYSISTISFGKISVSLIYNGDKKTISINIKDSGIGLTTQEINNLQGPFTGKIANPSIFTRSGITFYLCNQLTKKMNGTFSIKTSDAIGTHYEITLPSINEIIVKEYPALLEDVYIRLNIHNTDISQIVRNILTHYGAEFLDINESSPHTDWDLLITDNSEENFAHTILVNSSCTKINQLNSNLIEVNYNFADELIDAISLLIENSEPQNSHSVSFLSVSLDNQEASMISNESVKNALTVYRTALLKSDYKDLFITTVPIDINKLYNSASIADLIDLKNTAHRLKGVFAMLEFKLLHKLCEDLEFFIADKNELEIRNCIRELDISVKRLMPEGNQ